MSRSQVSALESSVSSPLRQSRGSPRLLQMSASKGIAGTLAAVLEAVDAQKIQQQKAKEQESQHLEMEESRAAALKLAWDLVQKSCDIVTQQAIVQFILDARCDHLPVKLFSDFSAYSEFLAQSSQTDSATVPKIVEPAVPLVRHTCLNNTDNISGGCSNGASDYCSTYYCRV